MTLYESKMILGESEKSVLLRGIRKAMTLIAVVFVLTFSGCARVQPYVPLTTAPLAPTGGFYYTVQRGETLYRIAEANHVDVSDLMRLNNIYSPTQLEPGRRLFISVPVIPSIVSKPLPYEPVTLEKARAIVGPRQYVYRWETITVHHSATLQGSARLFDRDHRRRKMGGLFYHFVIGNGSHTPDGSVEVGWRWKKQVKANRPYDIQVCLVGDFNKQDLSEAQFNSLANLITVLQEEYDIPLSRIRKHEDVKGSKPTECPGRNFPFHRLLSKLSQNGAWGKKLKF